MNHPRPLDLAQRDLAYVVHPYTNFKTNEATGPFIIDRGEGVYVYDNDGRRYLDFAWSYLIISSAQLQAILPHLQQRTFGLLAEIVLLLQDRLQTQDVDWLFWEDPFIEGRDRDELRKEREGSEQETRKRLMSNAPIIRLLLDRVQQLA